jgi:hypothetical protein
VSTHRRRNSAFVGGFDLRCVSAGAGRPDRVGQEGEPILCNLAPRANGYWGDSCNTIFVGERA